MTPSTPDRLDADELQQGVEFSAPLENSTPLEVQRVKFVKVPDRTTPALEERSQPDSQSIPAPVAVPHNVRPTPPQPAPMAPLINPDQAVVIPLLDERVRIDWRRRKVGEVVIRKEIDTHVVEVPVRRERLIVEQLTPTYEQLAVVELGSAQMVESDGSGAFAADHSSQSSVCGEFASVTSAIQFLAAIAAEPHPGVKRVQINIVLDDAAQQATYQRLLDQYSTEVRR